MGKNEIMANMLNMLVSTIGGELKNVVPTNNVAQFVKDNINILFKFPESDATTEFSFMTNIVSKVFILSANIDPQQTLDRFGTFTKAYINWLNENQTTGDATDTE